MCLYPLVLISEYCHGFSVLDPSLSVPGQVTAGHFSHIIRFINFIYQMHLQFWTFLCHLPLQMFSYLLPAGRTTDKQHNWQEENFFITFEYIKNTFKKLVSSLGDKLLPVIFSLTCSSIKGVLPCLVTSNTEQSDSEQTNVEVTL